MLWRIESYSWRADVKNRWYVFAPSHDDRSDRMMPCCRKFSLYRGAPSGAP
jgi:hypothetical protein